MPNIVEYNEIEKALSELREKYSFLPSCTDEDSYKKCKADYKAIRDYEIKLEKARKSLGEEARKHLDSINSEAKAIDEKLKEISAPFKLEKERYEAEKKRIEEERVAGIMSRINGMKAFVNDAQGASSSEISDIIQSVTLIDVAENFEEFTQQALQTKQEVIDTLSKMMMGAATQERNQEEQRLFRIDKAILDIKSKPVELIGASSSEIKAAINDLKCINYASFGEKADDAKSAIMQSSQMLDKLLSQAIENESNAEKNDSSENDQCLSSEEPQDSLSPENCSNSDDESSHAVYVPTFDEVVQVVASSFNMSRVEAEKLLKSF